MGEVLIIDDEQVVVNATSKILGLADLDCSGVLSGKAALDRLAHETFRVIVTDLMLPDISGLELIRMIAERWPATPLIAISGYATSEKATEAIRRGAFDFVAKPFDIDELLGVVERARRYAERAAAPIDQEGKRRSEHRYRLGVHAWAELDRDGTTTIGAAESFLETLGEVCAVELPDRNETIRQGGSLARIACRDERIHTVSSPLGGRVLEVNAVFASDPGLVARDPLFQGWLVRMIPTDLNGELPRLSST